jgi:hypothetical protein
VWGADFVVETRHVPRADPTRARGFALVGDADRWCVEMVSTPAATWADASPSLWVAARGERGEIGPVERGRCGDGYLLVLSPVTARDVPAPGSIIDAASAPLGTCLADPFDGASAAGDVAVTGTIEVVACEDPHFAEIYSIGQIDGGDFGPSWSTAAESCAAVFPTFVGIPGNLSAFASEPFTVTEAQWEAGRRAFSCVLYLSSDTYPLVGSARDSWR